jgi:hypothetical protein
MLLRDIKFYFITFTFCLLFAYFTLSLFAIGYEEDTNKTEVARFAYQTMGYIVFSLNFWIKLFPSIVPFVFSILTTSTIFTIIAITIKKY